MAKVAPYHTTAKEYEPHRNVYHDHDDCKDGKRILMKDRYSAAHFEALRWLVEHAPAVRLTHSPRQLHQIAATLTGALQ